MQPSGSLNKMCTCGKAGDSVNSVDIVTYSEPSRSFDMCAYLLT